MPASRVSIAHSRSSRDITASISVSGASPRIATASKAAAASDASPLAVRNREILSAPVRLDASAMPRYADNSARRSWSCNVAYPGIVYKLKTGCQWDAIPREFGSGSVC